MTPEEKAQALGQMVNDAIEMLEEHGELPADGLYGFIVNTTYFHGIGRVTFTKPVRIFFSDKVAPDYVAVATEDKIKELLDELE